MFVLSSRPYKTDKNMEKDVDTKAQAAVINTTNVTAPLPIVVKIEPPRDAEKQKKNKAVDDGEADVKKATKSRFCQLFPVLVFLVTFATVLTLLIIYLDPTSMWLLFSSIFCGLCVHLPGASRLSTMITIN